MVKQATIYANGLSRQRPDVGFILLAARHHVREHPNIIGPDESVPRRLRCNPGAEVLMLISCMCRRLQDAELRELMYLRWVSASAVLLLLPGEAATSSSPPEQPLLHSFSRPSLVQHLQPKALGRAPVLLANSRTKWEWKSRVCGLGHFPAFSQCLRLLEMVSRCIAV
jgi:hypothetical protein